MDRISTFSMEGITPHWPDHLDRRPPPPDASAVARAYNVASETLLSQSAFLLKLKAALVTDYTRQKNSRIQRFMNRDPLPIESSYINLAVVRDEEQKGKDASLLKKPGGIEREKHESFFSSYYMANRPVDLPELFTNQRTSRGERLLVEGKAGVGKSTACQFLANRWATYHLAPSTEGEILKKVGPWIEKYDLLIWIPLRDFFKNNRYSNLIAYVQEKYLPDMTYDEVRRELEMLEREGKVLYLYDGFDEIVDSLKTSPTKKEVFEKMIEKKNWVITSRPKHSFGLVEFDYTAHYEIIGFDNRNVQDYVEKYFMPTPEKMIPEELEEAKKRALGLLVYLNRYPYLSTLSKVPILLELLCFTWKHNLEVFNDRLSLTTLFTYVISSAIRRSLQKMDTSGLGSLTPNEFFTTSLTSLHIPVVHFLEKLAFTKMLEGRVVFERNDYFPLVREMAQGDEAEVIHQAAIRYELLRKAGEEAVEDHCEYSFVHLTFQEYFAARFLCRWIQDEVKFQSAEFDSPLAFIQKARFNERLHIVLWMTAGILAEEERTDPLNALFDHLLSEPRSFLRLHEEAVAIRCFDETGCNPLIVRGVEIQQRFIFWFKYIVEEYGQPINVDRFFQWNYKIYNNPDVYTLIARSFALGFMNPPPNFMNAPPNLKILRTLSFFRANTPQLQELFAQLLIAKFSGMSAFQDSYLRFHFTEPTVIQKLLNKMSQESSPELVGTIAQCLVSSGVKSPEFIQILLEKIKLEGGQEPLVGDAISKLEINADAWASIIEHLKPHIFKEKNTFVIMNALRAAGGASKYLENLIPALEEFYANIDRTLEYVSNQSNYFQDYQSAINGLSQASAKNLWGLKGFVLTLLCKIKPGRAENLQKFMELWKEPNITNDLRICLIDIYLINGLDDQNALEQVLVDSAEGTWEETENVSPLLNKAMFIQEQAALFSPIDPFNRIDSIVGTSMQLLLKFIESKMGKTQDFLIKFFTLLKHLQPKLCPLIQEKLQHPLPRIVVERYQFIWCALRFSNLKESEYTSFDISILEKIYEFLLHYKWGRNIKQIVCLWKIPLPILQRLSNYQRIFSFDQIDDASSVFGYPIAAYVQKYREGSELKELQKLAEKIRANHLLVTRNGSQLEVLEDGKPVTITDLSNDELDRLELKVLVRVNSIPEKNTYGLFF